MISQQIPITQTSLLSNATWWWKERHSIGGYEDVIREFNRHHVEDEISDNDEPVPTRESIKHSWFRASQFPSEVHVELLNRQIIPHPYVAFNEHEVQWVGETEWLYSCTFDAPSLDVSNATRLTFDGLDTLCDVYLNDRKILEVDNAFRQYVYEVPGEGEIAALRLEGNTLLLHFRCAKAYAKQQEEIHGKIRAGSTNLGDPSRVYLRKPQYDWRWDWGPELMTYGPYRNISLTHYAVRIDDFNPKASLDVLDGTFKLSLSANLTLGLSASALKSLREHPTGSDEFPFKLEVSLKKAEAAISTESVSLTKFSISELAIQSESGTFTLPLQNVLSWDGLEDLGVESWWPVGYGSQNLYEVSVKLIGPGDATLDSVSKKVGFRSVELVQEPLEEADQYGTGTTFFFKVNGVEMFMGGSNWIPADNFLTTISDDRYRQWLTILKDGGQNMVRIWGGGIYEPDIFYDICDELGILVWQDFQFACGVYPAHKSFVDSVRKEAEYNVKRLRHHPAITLFCGNNEDYQMVLQWGDVPHLPAVVIYEDVLPDVVNTLTEGSIPYHRGSPYGGKGWDTSDPTVGDVHQWNIWGGKELPWQEYGRLGGRFVSEFGIPAMPSMKTIEYWMQGVDPRERYAQSKIIAQHNRAGAFERRFAITMNENFRLTSDLTKHVFNTQVMQAEAVGLAYRAWKREWRGPGSRYCGGVLVWQLNDCWPVTSWAFVDYFLRPKPVYYVIARDLAPLTISMSREVVQNRANDRPKQFYEYGATRSVSAKLHIWATRTGNETVSEVVKLDIQYFDLENPEWRHRQDLETSASSLVSLAANKTTELGTFDVPEPPSLPGDIYNKPGTTTSGRVVASARLLHPETGEVLARFVDWPQPYRLLDIPDPGVEISTTESEGAVTIRVSVKRPAKCLFLTAEDDNLSGKFEVSRWSDNALDVVPFDEQVVKLTGLGKDAKVSFQCLQN
ncbi:hypothetical protein H1R20_g16307, partial [Candolleomyces eurysporus]